MEGCSDSIAAVRTQVIRQLLSIAHARVDLCLESEASLCRSNRHNANPEDCDAMVMGSFVRGLQVLNVLPRNDKNIPLSIDSMSIEAFADKLNNMKLKSPHLQCTDSLLSEEIGEALRTIPDPVLDSHRRHMDVQRGEEQSNV